MSSPGGWNSREPAKPTKTATWIRNARSPSAIGREILRGAGEGDIRWIGPELKKGRSADLYGFGICNALIGACKTSEFIRCFTNSLTTEIIQHATKTPKQTRGLYPPRNHDCG